MTHTQLQQRLHLLLNKDVDYPLAGEDDYVVRTGLLNDAIQTWASEEGVLWNQLFVPSTGAAGAELTVVTSQSAYDLPTDLDFLSSNVRVVETDGSYTEYALVKAGDAQLYANNTSDNVCWITGNDKSGKHINLSPTPTSVDNGKTIAYDYYKKPTELSGASDVIEMSDPNFAIYWALAELVADEDSNLADKYTQIALNKLAAMHTKNEMPAFWQQNSLVDRYAGFGDGE